MFYLNVWEDGEWVSSEVDASSANIQVKVVRNDVLILYVVYHQATEDELEITSYLTDLDIDGGLPVSHWFRDSHLLSDDTVAFRRIRLTQTGAYRIPLSIGLNEEYCRAVFRLIGDTSTLADVYVWAKPGAKNL